jgi:integrase
MSVTEAKLKAEAGIARERPVKLADRAGLYAFLSEAGGISWRYDYTAPGGKRRTLTIGRWPAVTIHRARQRRDEAEAMLADGVDPCDSKRERKREAMATVQKPTFKESALKWHEAQERRWTLDYSRQVLARLEADIFPKIGDKRFAEIRRSDILDTLREVEERGVGETVRRLRQYVGAIYRFAGAEDDSIIDPSPMLRGALKAPPPVKHQPKMRQDELGEFVLRLNEYDGEPETRLALQLTLYTLARTTEILESEWTEFELKRPNEAIWQIPAARMKMDDPHFVPLSTHAIATLEELQGYTGEGRLLFPVGRSTPGRNKTMSNNAMLFAMYRMGYRGRATVHGLRSNFSTWANENGWPSDDVELCLAHDERDRVRGAYNAAKRIEPRRKLLQAWADWLDQQRTLARRERLLG